MTNAFLTAALLASATAALAPPARATEPDRATANDPPWIARSKTGMVASDSPEASQAGAQILRAGGNAFDAAVATSFALTVARGQSTGIGGGGFMVAYIAAEDRYVALDFREASPAGASVERFEQLSAADPDGPPRSLIGGDAAAVPGQLAGLAQIARRFGTRPLADLIAPAIEIAETGFVVDQACLSARNDFLEDLQRWPAIRKRCAGLADMLRIDADASGDATQTALELGDRLRRPDLADALRRIARHGPDDFYRGEIAHAIVRAVQADGGPMTLEDLAAYRVVERTPLRTAFIPPGKEQSYEIIGMPPPSSGGVCIAEILHIIQACGDRSDLNPLDDRAHVLVEAMKHAFADRARGLGDPDFGDVEWKYMLDPRYAVRLAAKVRYRATRPPADYGRSGLETAADGAGDNAGDTTGSDENAASEHRTGFDHRHTGLEDRGTSHFCVVDRAGNVVSITETVNGSWGSCLVAAPFGIILNNEMDDFVTARGRANQFGLVQSAANEPAPGKRPLSSMSPTIVARDGKPVLALGASGGPRIITSTVQVLLNVITEHQPLADAIQALRLHHQWKPNDVLFDRKPDEATARRLESYGHQLGKKRKSGVVQAIEIQPNGARTGASDPKKGGKPAGVEE